MAFVALGATGTGGQYRWPMQILRTPDERFVDLDGFDRPAHYVSVGDGLRMAYVQAGPSDGPPVLLLHGEPSWSYLYRHMLPVLADAGLRAIVPDLIGFGRSDKPAAVEDHSYARHVCWVRALLDSLELTGITLVGQDWGGLIGLRLVAETDRFDAVVAANTGLPTGDHDMPEVWHRFRRAVRDAPQLDVARFIQSGCRTELDAAVRAGYDAPFPDESYKAGPRAMPELVPYRPDDPASGANRAAWDKLSTMDIPTLVAFSDSDPITSSMAPTLKSTMPGAHAREHPTIHGAGHFLQEDAGSQLAQHVVAFVRELATR